MTTKWQLPFLTVTAISVVQRSECFKKKKKDEVCFVKKVLYRTKLNLWFIYLLFDILRVVLTYVHALGRIWIEHNLKICKSLNIKKYVRYYILLHFVYGNISIWPLFKIEFTKFVDDFRSFIKLSTVYWSSILFEFGTAHYMDNKCIWQYLTVSASLSAARLSCHRPGKHCRAGDDRQPVCAPASDSCAVPDELCGPYRIRDIPTPVMSLCHTGEVWIVRHW